MTYQIFNYKNLHFLTAIGITFKISLKKHHTQLLFFLLRSFLKCTQTFPSHILRALTA